MGTITILTASQSYTILLRDNSPKTQFEQAAELKEKFNIQPWHERYIIVTLPSKMNSEDFLKNS
jgi:hypothetical protein